LPNRPSVASLLKPLGRRSVCSVRSYWAIGFAIWRELPWSRYLMVIWVSAGAAQMAQFWGDGAGNQLDLTWLLAVAIAAWYLFFKGNVVAYFKALDRARNRHAPAPET
jgi:hypothetical protein